MRPEPGILERSLFRQMSRRMEVTLALWYVFVFSTVFFSRIVIVSGLSLLSKHQYDLKGHRCLGRGCGLTLGALFRVLIS